MQVSDVASEHGRASAAADGNHQWRPLDPEPVDVLQARGTARSNTNYSEQRLDHLNAVLIGPADRAAGPCRAS